jgi:hypothetical protein
MRSVTHMELVEPLCSPGSNDPTVNRHVVTASSMNHRRRQGPEQPVNLPEPRERFEVLRQQSDVLQQMLEH